MSPTRIFMLGCALAIAVAATIQIFEINQRRENLNGLIEECKAQASAFKKTSNGHWRQFTLVCAPSKLMTPRLGIQGQIAASQREIYSVTPTAILVAMLIIAVSAIPYLWYFVLRRLKELRDVIAGK